MLGLVLHLKFRITIPKLGTRFNNYFYLNLKANAIRVTGWYLGIAKKNSLPELVLFFYCSIYAM